jgi:hypothetical protein
VWVVSGCCGGCRSGEGLGCPCRGCGRDAVLEVGVEELVRVQFGRVTGQIEGLDLFTISTAILRSTSGPHRRGSEGAALPHHARPSGAAAALGLPSSTLEARIKKLNIRKNRFELG